MECSIDLSKGGSFALKAQMLGDDTRFVTSNISNGITVERYKSIGLNVYNGQLKWEKQVVEINGEIDEAVYLLEVGTIAKIILYDPLKVNKDRLAEMLENEGNGYVIDAISYADEDQYIVYNNLANKLKEINSSFVGGGYNISVRAYYTYNTGKNVILAQSAPATSATIIPQTDIELVDGMLSWDLSFISSTGGEAISYFKNYQLQVFEKDSLKASINLTSSNYSLESNRASINLNRKYGSFEFNTGTPYTFKLVVVGDSVTSINSATTEIKNKTILSDINKLEGQNKALVIETIDKTTSSGEIVKTRVVKWNSTGCDELKVMFVIPKDEGDGTAITFKVTSTNGMYEFPEFIKVNGTDYQLSADYVYSFQVRAKGDSSNYISGFFSEAVTIQRLTKPTGVKVVDGKLVWNESRYVVNFETGEMASDGIKYRVVYTTQNNIDPKIIEGLEDEECIMDAVGENEIDVVVYAYHDEYIDSYASEKVTLTRLASTDVNSIQFVDDNNDFVNDWTVLTWELVGDNKYYEIMISDGTNHKTYVYQLKDNQTSGNWKIIVDDEFKGKDVTFAIKTLSKGEGYLLDSLYSTGVQKTISASINSLDYDYSKFALCWDPVNSGKTDAYYIGYTYTHTYNGNIETNTVYKNITPELVFENRKCYYYLPKIGTYSNIYVRVVSGNNEDGYALASQETYYINNSIEFNKFAAGRGIAGDEYIISNETELKNIALIPNAYYKLGDNIYLTNHYVIAENFTGFLDGNNKYIYGNKSTNNATPKYLISGVKEFVGLFKTCNGAIFKNINLSGFNIDVMPDGEDFNVSVLVSNATNTTFNNVTVVDSIIKVTKDVSTGNGYIGNVDNSGNIYIGAIAGYAKDCTFTGCEVIMLLNEDNENIIINAVGGPDINIYIGSIVGYMDGGNVSSQVEDTYETDTFILKSNLAETVGGDYPPNLKVGAVVGDKKNANIEGLYYQYSQKTN